MSVKSTNLAIRRTAFYSTSKKQDSPFLSNHLAPRRPVASYSHSSYNFEPPRRAHALSVRRRSIVSFVCGPHTSLHQTTGVGPTDAVALAPFYQNGRSKPEQKASTTTMVKNVRITYRRRHSYATKSNSIKPVKTPGTSSIPHSSRSYTVHPTVLTPTARLAL